MTQNVRISSGWIWINIAKNCFIMKEDNFAEIYLLHIMQTILTQLFDYNIISFRKMTFYELRVVLKALQLPMLLMLNDMKSETHKHVIGVFPSVKGDDFSYCWWNILKFIIFPFISETLGWCCGDGCKFLHAHEGFLLLPNVCTRRKIW